MIYIIIVLVIIGIILKIIDRVLLASAKLQKRKHQTSDDLIIFNGDKNTKPGELIANLSISPDAFDKLIKQYYYSDGVHNESVEKEEIIINKFNEYPKREKVFIYKDEFRFEGEDEYIIRLEQKPPDGFNNKIYEKVMLKGISYLSRGEVVNSFISGTNRIILLERSPSNQDKFGIKVIGIWQSTRKIRKAHLGWVPTIEAAQICTTYPKDTPLAATLRKIFKPRPDKNAGMRYDIWIP